MDAVALVPAAPVVAVAPVLLGAVAVAVAVAVAPSSFVAAILRLAVRLGFGSCCWRYAGAGAVTAAAEVAAAGAAGAPGGDDLEEDETLDYMENSYPFSLWLRLLWLSKHMLLL